MGGEEYIDLAIVSNGKPSANNLENLGDYIESYPNPCDTLRERPSRSRTLQGIPI